MNRRQFVLAGAAGFLLLATSRSSFARHAGALKPSKLRHPNGVHEIRLDANSSGRVFEGIGAVSAGASSRLLIDYPEPQRSQIIDYLFKPKFGAGFQHLKVEIGSGENSTAGCEPSHVITRAELANPRARGVEFWLMSEARKRNGKIFLDCLPWGYPAWVGKPFTREAAEWFAAFLKVARDQFGLELDWVSAAQNESGTNLDWIVQDLRPVLDRDGFAKVRLQAPDNDKDYWQIFDELEKNPAANKLIDAVGYHYIDGRDPWDIDQKNGHPATDKAKQSGKSLWASEEYSNSGATWDEVGAMFLARLVNKLYTIDRVTKVEIWNPIDCMYDALDWHDAGVMQADTPWCGFYTVRPAVWAVAHTTQFAQPGWVYMDDACGQIDPSTWRGSHVALRDPKTGDWSAVICTNDARRVRLHVAPGLRNGTVHVWKSTAKEQFVHHANLRPVSGALELDLEPDAIYTLTTTTGQHKGGHKPPAKPKPFPFPFEENFESYKPGDTARYFVDQKGTFEVVDKPGGGRCLAQIVPEEGIVWYGNKLLKPHVTFGDINWRDYSVAADVLVTDGDAEVGGRFVDGNKLGYRLILAKDGTWQLNSQSNKLAEGRLPAQSIPSWHRLLLRMHGDLITACVDGRKVAEVKDASVHSGMAFLACTYSRNLFDNVVVDR
jgi:galactosylceramidase